MSSDHYKSKDKEGSSNARQHTDTPTPTPTAWSQWLKHPDTGSFYCWRTGSNGQVEYKYQRHDDEQPRTLDSFPDTLSSVALGSSSTTESRAQCNYLMSSSTYYPPAGSFHQPTRITSTLPINYGTGYATPYTFTSSPGYPYSTNTFPGSILANANKYNFPTQPSQELPSGTPNAPQNTGYGKVEQLTQRLESTSLSVKSGVEQTEGTDGVDGEDQKLINVTSEQRAPAAEFRLNFRVHPSRFFKTGRVIKVLWTEPAGERSNSSSMVVYTTEKFITKIRRFVVIRNGQGHSQCLPISTYQHQATLKAGVVAEDHVAVYTDPTKSSSLLRIGEVLSRPPIQIIPATPREKLETTSRLNLVKIHTVEHNIKIGDVGYVARSDLRRLLEYIQESWKPALQ